MDKLSGHWVIAPAAAAADTYVAATTGARGPRAGLERLPLRCCRYEAMLSVPLAAP